MLLLCDETSMDTDRFMRYNVYGFLAKTRWLDGRKLLNRSILFYTL
jgi:hypothetical protein